MGVWGTNVVIGLGAVDMTACPVCDGVVAMCFGNHVGLGGWTRAGKGWGGSSMAEVSRFGVRLPETFFLSLIFAFFVWVSSE